jgi:hypothetical protein
MTQKNERSLWPCKSPAHNNQYIHTNVLRVIMGANIAGEFFIFPLDFRLSKGYQTFDFLSNTYLLQVSMGPRSSDPTTSPSIAVASLSTSLSSQLVSRLRSFVSSTIRSGDAPRLPKFRSSLLVKMAILVRAMKRVRVTLDREMTVHLRLGSRRRHLMS